MSRGLRPVRATNHAHTDRAPASRKVRAASFKVARNCWLAPTPPATTKRLSPVDLSAALGELQLEHHRLVKPQAIARCVPVGIAFWPVRQSHGVNQIH